MVENLSLFALIYLMSSSASLGACWESFIIRLDILIPSGWTTRSSVENLSLFALIYLFWKSDIHRLGWESFIIRLDILRARSAWGHTPLRIFHYSPWYTYSSLTTYSTTVENLSLFALIYLPADGLAWTGGWESFIIRLDILNARRSGLGCLLRIFHYSPWYTYFLL